MAGLTAGHAYFIESEAAQQNWVGGSGDPDDIVIGNFTEGTHYCSIEIPINIRILHWTGIKISDSSTGRSYDDRTGMRGYQIPINGWVTSRANAYKIDEFFMSDRHTNPSLTTFKYYYLILYFGSNDQWKFTDHNGSQQFYCKGSVQNGYFLWERDHTALVRYYGTFRSVWR